MEKERCISEVTQQRLVGARRRQALNNKKFEVPDR